MEHGVSNLIYAQDFTLVREVAWAFHNQFDICDSNLENINNLSEMADKDGVVYLVDRYYVNINHYEIDKFQELGALAKMMY